MNIDWIELEEALYHAVLPALERFSKDHLGESFYGLAFSCNADYGEVSICLNTRTGLQAAVADRYATYTPEEVTSGLEWNPGDWEYRDINVDPPNDAAWDAAWSGFQESVVDAALDDDEGDEATSIFMESVCRVAIAMEKNDDFRWIRRDPDFKVFVTDHDESAEDAWERLRIIRGYVDAGTPYGTE